MRVGCGLKALQNRIFLADPINNVSIMKTIEITGYGLMDDRQSWVWLAALDKVTAVGVTVPVTSRSGGATVVSDMRRGLHF
ncbi:hypothetical protein RIF29_40871 [Crotalaria pallida]|uniref:Uncharacterized protein n=1 Tax=Crotalaria pallida TaxID=3830 RepID=A0AAN9HR03_CROPI